MRNDVKSLLQKINQAGIPYQVFESDAAPDEDDAAPPPSPAALAPAKAPAADPKPAAIAPTPPESASEAPQFKGLFRQYSASGEPVRPAAGSPRLADIFAEMQRLKGG